jgi:hypothetical protein
MKDTHMDPNPSFELKKVFEGDTQMAQYCVPKSSYHLDYIRSAFGVTEK